jgi:hypothetical protein
MITDVQDNTTCCYAVQDKVWVDDPDQVPWEVYTVLADTEGSGMICSATEQCEEAGVSVTASHCC